MNSNRLTRWFRAVATAFALGATLAVGIKLAITAHPSPVPAVRSSPARVASATAEPTTDSERDAALAELRAELAAGVAASDVATALVEFGRRDPARALDVAQWLARSPAERYEFVAAIAGDWATRDQERAWQWTLTVGTACDVVGAPPVPAVVLTRIAARDPARVVTLVRSLLDHSNRPQPINVAVVADDALGAIVEHAGTDAGWCALQTWSRSPAAEQLGRGVFERAAAGAPSATAAERLAALPGSSGRNFALADVTAAWAARDPRPALAWAQTLPEQTRADVSAAAFARWEANDPLAAAEWLGGAAANGDNDRLIAHLVSDPRIAHSDVRAALTLAESVGDTRLRCQSIESVVRRWAETDVVAATNYVNRTSTLSADERRRILAALQDDSVQSQEPRVQSTTRG